MTSSRLPLPAPQASPAVSRPSGSSNFGEQSVRVVVYVLFFLTGISGLIYQVVWTRQLTYVFGASLYAVASVVAAFMGGLALGSWVFGRVADRARRRLVVYGLLEVGVGGCALLLPVFLRSAHPLYRYIYQNFETSFAALSLLRLFITFIIILVPTTLMGGTLPVLSAFVARRRDALGGSIGGLYALNTLGAVLGTFLAGFVLIAAVGIRGTTGVAVAINLIVAAVAVMVSFRCEPLPELPDSQAEGGIEVPGPGSGNADPLRMQDVSPLPSPADSKTSGADQIFFITPAQVRLVLFVYFLAGLTGLAFQVLWTRALVFTFLTLKNTTYAFSGLLVVFLAGLALGSGLMARLVDRQKDPLRLLGVIQLSLGILGAFSLILIYYRLPGWEPLPEFGTDPSRLVWWAAVGNVLIKSAAAFFLPTLLMGMTFPVVARLCVPVLRRAGRSVGRMYALNTVGAILGSLLAGFALIPVFGIAGSIMAMSWLCLLGAGLLFWSHRAMSRLQRTVLLGVTAAAAVILLVRYPFRAQFQPLEPGEKLVFYEEGPLCTVSVVEHPFGHRTLYVDGVGVAGTDRILLTDQKSLAHVPMLLVPGAASALTVGFGSGGASYSYTLYDELQHIDCVEIAGTVLHAAPVLTASNHGVLERRDPRYRVILDDARSYLQFTASRYDIIATDCTDLRYKTNANLYDLEYFTLCRERLTERGVVVVWMPLAGLSDEAFRVALRTFFRVFPHMSVWYMNNEPTHYILLAGSRSPQTWNYEYIRRRLQDPKVAGDLAELRLDDPDKILSCFITDERRLADMLAGDILNTENSPYLEFESPKYGYGDKPLIDNLALLERHRVSVLSRLAGASAQAHERLNRFERAAPLINQGHMFYRTLNLLDAARSWLEARSTAHGDRSLDALLEFTEMRRRIEVYPAEWGNRLTLGRIDMMRERWNDALAVLEPILTPESVLARPSIKSARPPAPAERAAAARLMAQCNERLGNRDEAVRLYALASQIAAGR
ncbi:MAG: fused MFS/spermidine synthase [Candidatus Sumerlaeia bacterium]